MGLLDEVSEDINFFENNFSNVFNSQEFLTQLLHYKCEFDYTKNDLKTLENNLSILKKQELTPDQNMSSKFYQCVVLFSQKKLNPFMPLLDECLIYFTKIKNNDRLIALYKMLAEYSEEKRQYKNAAQYYSNLVKLLDVKVK